MISITRISHHVSNSLISLLQNILLLILNLLSTFSFVYLLDELNHMILVSQLIVLYDLIFDVAIVHILFLLNWCLPFILKVLHFSCLEKLELVLK